MSSPLWMSIQPTTSDLRLMLSVPQTGTVLRARLQSPPRHPKALGLLLEALASWYRLPLHAVLDADGADAQADPELWALLLGELPSMNVHVEWVARRAPARRNRAFDEFGPAASARRLINHAATGQP